MNKHLSIAAFFVSVHCMVLAESSKLASNSPFLPPGYNKQEAPPLPKPVQQTSGPLSKDFEFRGIVQIDDEYQFSLFKKSENKAYWITENVSENGILISDFDLDSLQITLTADGRSEQLTLMEASGNPIPVPAATSPMPTTRASNPAMPPIPDLDQKKATTNGRRTIPRRRVILPRK